MKAKTIGYYKNVQNVGDVNAAVDLKVGIAEWQKRAGLSSAFEMCLLCKSDAAYLH